MVTTDGTCVRYGGMNPGDQNMSALQREMPVEIAKGDIGEAIRASRPKRTICRPLLLRRPTISCAKRPTPPDTQRSSYPTTVWSLVSAASSAACTCSPVVMLRVHQAETSLTLRTAVGHPRRADTIQRRFCATHGLVRLHIFLARWPTKHLQFRPSYSPTIAIIK